MRRAAAIVVASCVAAVVALAPAPAVAQKAEATTAFQRGQQLRRDGKFAEAAAAFELSMKLEPQYGTQYNLALCYLDLGRTASAWAELDELSNRDPNEPRRADAARRARELRPRLTSFVIRIAQSVPGLVVTRDGIDVTLLAGVPTPVDPGSHRFSAHAPGRREWSADLDVAGPGKTIDVAVPALDPIAAPAPAPTPIAPPPPAPAPAPSEHVDLAARDDHPGRTRRIAGLTTAAGGAIVLGIGSWYGIRALSRGSDARDACGGKLSACTGDAAKAQRLVSDGRHFATISNYTLAGGAVLAATGIVLYFTAPGDVTAVPVAGADRVGFAVLGRF